jgi:predicted SAM-dependent methyltransferase
MKINVGCGTNRLEGWVNTDAEVDITKPLPWPNEVADMILAEHVVEHVNSHEALRFFMEARRVLKPQGILRVCVPALDDIIDREHARDLVFGHGHQMIFSKDVLFQMLWAAGFNELQIAQVHREECDGHWKVIGKEKDDIETLRMEAIK